MPEQRRGEGWVLLSGDVVLEFNDKPVASSSRLHYDWRQPRPERLFL